MYMLNCALRLVLLPFLTTATAFVITTPPPTPTERLAPAQRTRYGAYGPQQTFFQIQPTLEPGHELRKREYVTIGINTCGWTSQNANQPKTCPPGLGCGWIKGDEQYEFGMVCVPFDDNQEFNWADAMLPTTCVGYGGLNVTIGQAYSLTWSSTLWCGASATACATAVFDGGPSLISGVSTSFKAYTYTSMFCGDEVTRVNVYQGVTNSISSSGPATSSSFSSSSSSSSSSFPITSSSTLPPSKDRTSGSSTSSSAVATSNSDPTPVGEIAGATVGGVLGVAALAGLAFFVLWRRKHNRQHTPLEISRAPSEMDYRHPNPYMDSPQQQYRMGYLDSPQNRMGAGAAGAAGASGGYYNSPPQQQRTEYLPHMTFGDGGPYAENRPFMQGIGRAV